jgi:hypothetical protein
MSRISYIIAFFLLDLLSMSLICRLVETKRHRVIADKAEEGNPITWKKPHERDFSSKKRRFSCPNELYEMHEMSTEIAHTVMLVTKIYNSCHPEIVFSVCQITPKTYIWKGVREPCPMSESPQGPPSKVQGWLKPLLRVNRKRLHVKLSLTNFALLQFLR